MKRIALLTLAALLFFALLSFGRAHEDFAEDENGPSAVIIGKYLQATQAHDASRSASMEVDINAAIPELNEHGQLHALRVISKVGHITYRVLGFKGDNTVKNQVIARYLQAEQQGQGDPNLSITPTNYKFKLRGEKQIYRRDAFLFQLSPRKKKIGLFKGEMFLDSKTFLPLFEKGRFIKNPSIFFKRVEFERAYSIENGVAVPQYMSSIVYTRVVGRVAVDVFYSNFAMVNNAARTAKGPGALSPVVSK